MTTFGFPTSKTFRVLNKTRNVFLADQVELANTFLSRSIGLLNRKKLETNQGLLITRCRSIHMFFMRFPIDAIFVNKEHRVVGIVKNIKPFQLSPIFFKANYVIELTENLINKTQTNVGDQIQLDP